MIAIDYTCKDGSRAADVFCAKCMTTHGVDAIYDGDPRRPATAKDADEDEQDRDVIACDGCGVEEELPS